MLALLAGQADPANATTSPSGSSGTDVGAANSAQATPPIATVPDTDAGSGAIDGQNPANAAQPVTAGAAALPDGAAAGFALALHGLQAQAAVIEAAQPAPQTGDTRERTQKDAAGITAAFSGT